MVTTCVSAMSLKTSPQSHSEAETTTDGAGRRRVDVTLIRETQAPVDVTKSPIMSHA